MKLFVIAALVAVSSAARLEHLERGYLPPIGGQADAIGSGPNGLGPNGLGPNGLPGQNALPGQNGLGPNKYGANGRSGLGAQGRGSLGPFGAATSNQYLPPDQGPAGSNALGSGPFRSCCGQQGLNGQNQGLGSQPGIGAQPSLGLQSPFGSQPNSQYGAPQFGAAPTSQFDTPQFGAAPNSQYGAPQFGAAPGSQYGAPQFGVAPNTLPGAGAASAINRPGAQFQSSQYSATNRQYLAPKTSNNFENIPQQDFDEETGYHY